MTKDNTISSEASRLPIAILCRFLGAGKAGWDGRLETVFIGSGIRRLELKAHLNAYLVGELHISNTARHPTTSHPSREWRGVGSRQ